MDSSMVKYLLDFVYTGEISISKESLESFLSTADKIKLKGFTFKETETKSSSGNKNVTESEVTIVEEEELIEENAALFNLDEEYVSFKNSEYTDTDDDVSNNDESIKTDKIDDDVKGSEACDVSPKLEEDTQSVEEDIKSKMLKYGYQWNWNKPDFAKLREEAGPGIHCHICERMEKFTNFKSLDELYEHEKVAHKRKELYKCESCEEEFHKILLLNQHKRKVHSTTGSESQSNSCDICGKSFKTEKAMKKHRDYSHPVPGKTFKCKLCDKESLTKNASSVHYYQSHTAAQRKAFEGKMISSD